MPTRKLPASPDLSHLKSQARDLMKARPKADPALLQRIREFHPRFDKATDDEIAQAEFSLSDAQLTIAREYGFASWPRLKAFVAKPEDLERPLHERIADPELREAVARIDEGDLEGLLRLIDAHPRLTSAKASLEGGNYFREPTLLEFAMGNPIRHASLPKNLVEIVRALLEAGAEGKEALALVASGRLAREHGFQIPVIELLVGHGADPNGAMAAALAHGEFEAVEAILRLGACLTFDAAAAMGKQEEAKALLLNASPDERHRGLAYAAHFGHADIVRLLLESGEDPNRYNPIGGHSHATPMHLAAYEGHLEVLRVLLAFGARTDIKDVLWNGTAVGWAEHGGQQKIVRLLAQWPSKLKDNQPMTAAEIVEELRPMGKESYKKVMRSHGIPEPFFGTSIGDMQPIRKRIKKDYALSKELYATGIYDAMYLAGLVADEKRMTPADLQEWLDKSTCHALSTSTVAAVAAESAHGWELGLQWIEDADEWKQCAGWASLSGVVALRDNAELDLDAIRGLMQRILSAIHRQTDGVKYSMNNFVISVGAYVQPLADEAMRTAEAIGKVEVKLVGDCKMPFAPEYIEKCRARGSLTKKRKMIRC
jgi:hypothetical protein